MFGDSVHRFLTRIETTLGSLVNNTTAIKDLLVQLVELQSKEVEDKIDHVIIRTDGLYTGGSKSTWFFKISVPGKQPLENLGTVMAEDSSIACTVGLYGALQTLASLPEAHHNVELRMPGWFPFTIQLMEKDTSVLVDERLKEKLDMIVGLMTSLKITNVTSAQRSDKTYEGMRQTLLDIRRDTLDKLEQKKQEE
jgi:hypothetical protein